LILQDLYRNPAQNQ